MRTFIALPLLAVGCYAACSPATKDGDVWEAICIDETTGIDFLFLDMDGSAYKAALSNLDTSAERVATEGISAQHSAAIGDAMYDRFVSGAELAADAASNSTAIEQRDLTEFWENCVDKVSGVCANDNTPVWLGTISGFVTAIAGTLAYLQQNKKTNSSPRSVCITPDTSGSYCVAWAACYPADMTQQQINDIANGCAQGCQIFGDSCEARVVTESVTQYFCVSNRPDHCSANGQIKQC